MLDDHMLVSSTGDLTVPGNLIIGSTTIQANVNDHANSAYNQANTATTNAGSSSSYANSAYLQANTADQRAVTSGVYANAAFTVANTKFNSTGGTISGNVNITGNLNITGNTVTHASDSLVINDPLILLANNNPGNLLDTGFIAHYIEGGTTKHTGLVRDSSANTYYLFDGYTPHIQETNILDPNNASLRITTLRSNLISDSVSVRGYDVVNHTNTAFSQANTATTNAATADQRAVTSGVYANSAFATANSKTSNVGTVTSVGGTGSYGGLTLTGTVTTSGSLTLGGTPTGTWPITAANITGQTNSATITASTTAGAASTIVQRDGNGYIFNNYFNSTDNSIASGVTAIIAKQNDNYYRSATAAAVAAFITGQSMNINGNAATATALQTSRTINGTPFNGTSNITVVDGSKLMKTGDTLTGSITGTANSIIIGNNAGAIRGYLYNDTAGFGLLTSGGGWAVRVVYGSSTVIFDGYAESSASLRAPIFYDSNNTGYYSDPASRGNYNQATFGGGLQFSGKFALNASGASLDNSTGMFLTESYGAYWNGSNSATWHHQVINASSLCGISAGGTNWGSGNFASSGYMRSPIFYDHNNTGYYCDPDATSRLSTMTLGNGAFAYLYFTDDESTTSNKSVHANSNVIGFLNGAGGWCVYYDHSGNGVMGGTLSQNSDEKLKKDWTALPTDFIERLATVKHGTYTRIDTGERQTGASANDMKKIIPEVVTETKEGNLSLAYGNAALVSSIALAQRIIELERRLDALES
jgi:hypothetical protein